MGETVATTTAKKTSTAKSGGAASTPGNKRRTARGGAGAELTDEQNAEQGFTASESLSENLQKVLVDLIELSLQGKQAHWNVVGRNFRDTHLQLDEIIEAARDFGDTVAERMRSLHALPDGRSDQVAQTTTLPEFPQGEIATSEVIDLMTERLDSVAQTCRDVHDDVDEEDPTSADILHAILERVEQLSWMVSAENRTPKR